MHDVSYDDHLAPEDMADDERCPIILLSKDEKRRMRQNSLIIKMFDGNLGYMGLMRRPQEKMEHSW